MNKIYLSGNYVIVEKDGNVYEYPRTLSVYTIQGSNYVIKERIDDGQFVLPIADIGTYFDEAGAVAYTEATLVTFLRENTGFKTAGGGSPATEFIFSVKTDNAGISASDSFIIPTTGVGYNYDVDWGDGNFSSGVTGSVQHTYSSIGTYTIKISGLFPRIYFNGGGDALKLLEIQNWGTIAWGPDVRDSFDGCSNMILTANDVPDLSGSLIFREFFRSCTVFSGNASMNNWDVSSMQDARLFFLNSNFNSDISGWNTTGVNNMQQMFQNTPFNHDISNWNVSNVTTMYLCFFGCSIDQNLGAWNLRTFGVSLSNIFRSSGMSIANYTDTIVGWANYVKTNGGPLNTNMATQTGMTFDTSRNGGLNFATAGDARTYLTSATPTGAGWTISSDTVI